MKSHDALGIDIGGTKIAVGLVGADGHVLAVKTMATESRFGPNDASGRIVRAVRQILQDEGRNESEVAGIGIGCAGPVYPLRGIIDNPHTLPGWEHWNIVDALVGELGLPVWLENDADAAALGEYHHGAGHRADCLVMLTFGTGVGGAVLSRGRIFRGASGGHPEIGHMPIAFSGVRCYCGREGCLESTVSGPAIAAFGQMAGFAGAAEVFAAAKEDASARDILATVRGAIEAAIWTLVHVYCPARIVLGGGLVEAYPQFFLEAARNAARSATLISEPPVAIAAAQLGNRAGLVGAACWALECHATTRRTPSQVMAPVNSAPS